MIWTGLIHGLFSRLLFFPLLHPSHQKTSNPKKDGGVETKVEEATHFSDDVTNNFYGLSVLRMNRNWDWIQIDM